MIRKALFAAILPLAALSACGQAPAQDAAPEPTMPMQAEMPDMTNETDADAAPMIRMGGDVISASGEAIGILNIVSGPNGLLLEVTIDPNGLTPGWHGLHLHAVGNCDDLGVFKNSGGHVGMAMGGHGLLNPAGPEGGDLPNIWAAIDGSAGYEAFTTLTTAATLADEDGAALIIHEARDDHMTQPIGGAGGRVACAVIR
jgi:Cu-Zn family superoxide dismutase